MSAKYESGVVVITGEMTAKDREGLNSFMDEWQKSMEEEVQKIATSLADKIPDERKAYTCALDVFYLRGRSRHTDAVEAELIRLHAEGKPPNIMEWP